MISRANKILSKFQQPLHKILGYYSSQSQQTFEQKRLKLKANAQLAKQIINLITYSQPTFQQLKTKSLSTKILQLINQKIEKQKYGNQIKQLFEGGIKLNRNIFKQRRLRGKKQLQIEKFTFYPTHLITSQIFNYILNYQEDTYILTGHYGISKTVSFCLFWHLSQYINAYRFNKNFIDQNFQKQTIHIPKVIYISFNTSLELQKVKNIIKIQCPEIKEQIQKEKDESILPNQSLEQIYGRLNQQVQLMLIVDQIHVVASYWRRTEYNRKNSQSTYNLQDRDIIAMNSIFKSWKEILLMIPPLFQKVIFLSSVSIQSQFPKRVDLLGDSFHVLPSQNSVIYPKIIYKRKTMLELVYYFMFELQQVMPIKILQKFKNLSVEDKKQLVNKCFNYLNQRVQNFYTIHLDIHQRLKQIYIKQQKTTVNITQNLQKIPFIQTIFDQFKNVIKYSTSAKIQALKNFSKTAEDASRYKNKMALIQMIAVKSIKFANQQYQKILKQRQMDQINIDKQNSWINQNQYQVNISSLRLQQKQIVSLMDRRFFSYNCVTQSIKLLLSPRIVGKVFQPIVDIHTLYRNQTKNQLPNKALGKDDFGVLIQNSLLLLLVSGIKQFKLFLKKQQNQKIIIQFNNLPKYVYGFQSLEKRQQNNKKQNQKKVSQQNKSHHQNQNNFLQSFIPSIQEMKNDSVKCAVFIPLKQDLSFILKHSTTTKKIQDIMGSCNPFSKCIDLALVQQKSTLQNPEYDDRTMITLARLWLFDVFTGEIDQSKGKTKLQKFLEQFTYFSNPPKTYVKINEDERERISFKLNYYVINFKKDIQAQHRKLQKKFKNVYDLKFEINNKSIKVKRIDGSSQSIELSIGFLDMENDLQYDMTNQDAQYLKHFLIPTLLKKKEQAKQADKQRQEQIKRIKQNKKRKQ